MQCCVAFALISALHGAKISHLYLHMRSSPVPCHPKTIISQIHHTRHDERHKMPHRCLSVSDIEPNLLRSNTVVGDYILAVADHDNAEERRCYRRRPIIIPKSSSHMSYTINYILSFLRTTPGDSKSSSLMSTNIASNFIQ